LFLGYKFAQNMHRLHEIVKNIKGGMMAGLVILGAGISAFILYRKFVHKKHGHEEDDPSGTGGPPVPGARQSPNVPEV
jgi:hypothetical protein